MNSIHDQITQYIEENKTRPQYDALKFWSSHASSYELLASQIKSQTCSLVGQLMYYNIHYVWH